MYCRSQWPRGLKRRSSAARLLRLWVRIPPETWMFVCCECCVLSGRGLCDWLITRPEESYRLWRVVVCDQETSKTRGLKPATGPWKYNHNGLQSQENKQTNKQYQCINKISCLKITGKAMPLLVWTGPEGSRRLRLSDFKTVSTWRR